MQRPRYAADASGDSVGDFALAVDVEPSDGRVTGTAVVVEAAADNHAVLVRLLAIAVPNSTILNAVAGGVQVDVRLGD